jgi:hypothetical protein
MWHLEHLYSRRSDWERLARCERTASVESNSRKSAERPEPYPWTKVDILPIDLATEIFVLAEERICRATGYVPISSRTASGDYIQRIF